MLQVDPSPGQGFSLLNLGILVAILAVLWPLLQLLRKAASRHRRRQYSSEEPERGFTQDDDPDLRRDGR